MVYYGKQRTQDWPKRQYPPMFTPAPAPVIEEGHYCYHGKHWTTAPAMGNGGKGCPQHSTPHWKRVAKAAESLRRCKRCKKDKAQSLFVRPGISGNKLRDVCADCTRTRHHFCCACRAAHPVHAFSKGYTSLQQRVCDTCGPTLVAA